jgi:Spy/CpxP family protein refolding chaperone
MSCRAILILILIGLPVGLGMADYSIAQPPRDPEKGQERMEILQMWRMMEALDLDKATADKIFQIRSKYREERKKLEKALNEDFQQLRERLRETSYRSADPELEKILRNIREKREKLQGLWKDQYDEVSKVLSIRQQAQLVLFLKDFQEEIRSIIRPPGMRRPPGPTEGRPGPGLPPPLPPGPGPGFRPESHDEFPEGR